MAHVNIVVVDQNWAKIPAYRLLSSEFSASDVACYTDARPVLDDRSAQPPDIVILDGDTTRVDIVAFARRFKERAAAVTPLIMVMGSDVKLAERARANGVDVFMQKPISTELFMQLMHEVVNVRAARARLAATARAAGRL
jgi:FixJ family two-component response regulator